MAETEAERLNVLTCFVFAVSVASFCLFVAAAVVVAVFF